MILADPYEKAFADWWTRNDIQMPWRYSNPPTSWDHMHCLMCETDWYGPDPCFVCGSVGTIVPPSK